MALVFGPIFLKFLLFFYCNVGGEEGWHKPFIFFVPEKYVYNFVCILKMYCDTFNLGEKFSIADLKSELWNIGSAPQAARSC